MRSKLPLVCLPAIPWVSVAQTNNASWTNLRFLLVGQKIQIADTSSKTHNGVFASVSDAAISIKTSKGEESVQKPDVRTVKLVKSNHRMRNTFIGFGVGAGAGAGIGAATGESEGFPIDITRGMKAGVGAVLGGLGGAVVGALLPSGGSTIIYTASPQ
jgi:hypothetical protein